MTAKRPTYTVSEETTAALAAWAAAEQAAGRSGNRSELVETLLRAFLGLGPRCPGNSIPSVSDRRVAAAIRRAPTLTAAARDVGLSLAAVSRRAKKLGVRG